MIKCKLVALLNRGRLFFCLLRQSIGLVLNEGEKGSFFNPSWPLINAISPKNKGESSSGALNLGNLIRLTFYSAPLLPPNKFPLLTIHFIPYSSDQRTISGLSLPTKETSCFLSELKLKCTQFRSRFYSTVGYGM